MLIEIMNDVCLDCHSDYVLNIIVVTLVNLSYSLSTITSGIYFNRTSVKYNWRLCLNVSSKQNPSSYSTSNIVGTGALISINLIN